MACVEKQSAVCVAESTIGVTLGWEDGKMKSGVRETQHRLSKLEDIKGEAMSPSKAWLGPQTPPEMEGKELRGCCALWGQ